MGITTSTTDCTQNVNQDDKHNKCVDCKKYKQKIFELNEQINSLKNDDNPQNKSTQEEIKKIKEEKDYEYIVFSGGGIKGISYCGALDELIKEKKDILKNMKGFAGTSAGSIIASFLAIGYTPEELRKLLSDIDFAKMIGNVWDVPFEIADLIDEFGISSGDYFFDFLGKQIEAKTGNPDYTIEDLYKDTGKILVIVGTDMSYRIPLYFYHKKSLPIRNAIRISMSVPFVFKPGIYKKSLCVDGGVLDNFPLHVFDGKYPGERDARLNLCPPNPKVLGLRIVTKDESYMFPQKYAINSVFDFTMSLGDVLMANNEMMVMTPSYWYRTINILTPAYPMYQFTLTKKQEKKLLKDGAKAVRKFFN